MRRPAYTLLEVLLALSIAVVVLAAVYSFIGYQLAQAQAGRDLVERTNLTRALFDRLDREISAALALTDPLRVTPPSTNNPNMDEPEAEVMAVALPLGVVGSSTQLDLYVSKVPLPGEAPAANNGMAGSDSGEPISDLCRTSYGLAEDGGGLCRFETWRITSAEGTTPGLPAANVQLLAEEVTSVTFRYYDGSSWVSDWDSLNTLGPDNKTPIGSPRAIEITLRFLAPNGNPNAEERSYKHVVVVHTAGGNPTQAPTEGGTTP